MSTRQQDVLRLEPHMIPELRAAFDSALSDLGQALVDLGNRGYLPTAWLGDETSAAVAGRSGSRGAGLRARSPRRERRDGWRIRHASQE